MVGGGKRLLDFQTQRKFVNPFAFPLLLHEMLVVHCLDLLVLSRSLLLFALHRLRAANHVNLLFFFVGTFYLSGLFVVLKQLLVQFLYCLFVFVVRR